MVRACNLAECTGLGRGARASNLRRRRGTAGTAARDARDRSPRLRSWIALSSARGRQRRWVRLSRPGRLRQDRCVDHGVADEIRDGLQDVLLVLFGVQQSTTTASAPDISRRTDVGDLLDPRGGSRRSRRGAGRHRRPAAHTHAREVPQTLSRISVRRALTQGRAPSARTARAGARHVSSGPHLDGACPSQPTLVGR